MKIVAPIFTLCFALVLANSLPVFAQGRAENSSILGTQKEPLAEASEKFYDFGELTEGKKYVHNFIIRNIGTAPLEITKVVKT